MTPGEVLARRFYDAFGRLAPSHGCESPLGSDAFDPTTPRGQLMIAACDQVLMGVLGWSPADPRWPTLPADDSASPEQ